MQALRAKVENGRLILDVPMSLPEGTVFDLVVDDEGDELDEEERKALHEAIDRSLKQIEAGQVRDAADVIADLRSRR